MKKFTLAMFVFTVPVLSLFCTSCGGGNIQEKIDSIQKGEITDVCSAEITWNKKTETLTIYGDEYFFPILMIIICIAVIIALLIYAIRDFGENWKYLAILIAPIYFLCISTPRVGSGTLTIDTKAEEITSHRVNTLLFKEITIKSSYNESSHFRYRFKEYNDPDGDYDAFEIIYIQIEKDVDKSYVICDEGEYKNLSELAEALNELTHLKSE